MPVFKVHRKKTVAKRGEAWDEQKKIDVVQSYILLGQLRLAAATCGVPEPTVKVWRATQWWKDTESELRRSSKLVLSAKLNDIISKSITALDDRITGGDYIYNYKTKECVRVPIKADVVQKITGQLIDRSLMLEKAAVKEVSDDIGLDARLAKIKQDLLGFLKKPKLAQKITEKDVIDVEPNLASKSILPESQGLPDRSEGESSSRGDSRQDGSREPEREVVTE